MTAPRVITPFQGPIDAVVTPPGSKSITNRALLVAALAEGTSVLHGALHADDTVAMINCVRLFGARVVVSDDETTLTVTGTAGVLSDASPSFFAQQSGTTARFLAAVLALGQSPLTLDAEKAMRGRPMATAFASLRQLGVSVEALGEADCLPATIAGPVPVVGEMPTLEVDGSVSSQFTSGLLLAAPGFPEGLKIRLGGDVVSRPYLEMTASVMSAFGASISKPDEMTFVVEPGGYQATDFRIEPDASAASYFFAAAAICGGSVRVDGLGSSSLQGDIKFVDALAAMGADVSIEPNAITVCSAPLHGITADFSQISDTAQTIAAVAVFADGPTSITGIGFIRRKETDRIAAVVAELQRLGITAREDEDGFTVVPGPTRSAVIETYDDHRMAMSMTLIGLAREGVSISDPECVAKTFPAYFEAIEQLRPGGAS